MDVKKQLSNQVHQHQELSKVIELSGHQLETKFEEMLATKVEATLAAKVEAALATKIPSPLDVDYFMECLTQKNN